jgi:hypothetical protein
MTRTFVPAALLAAALTTPPASADPIVITGGTLNSGSPVSDFRAVFSLTVDGGTIAGEWPRGAVAAINCFGGCLPGTVISPNAIWLYPEVPSEIATPLATGSVLGAGPFLSGMLRFLGEGLTLPPVAGGAGGEVILDQPFSFSGWATAYPAVSRGTFVPDPLVSLDLIGAGTAHLRFRLDTLPDGRSFYAYRQTTYEFEPIPEPFTMLTVGTGLALLWRKRSR